MPLTYAEKRKRVFHKSAPPLEYLRMKKTKIVFDTIRLFRALPAIRCLACDTTGLLHAPELPLFALCGNPHPQTKTCRRS